jgi:hypothetical protein
MFLFVYNRHNLTVLDKNVPKVVKLYFYSVYVL